jgi:HEAT repeat protein
MLGSDEAYMLAANATRSSEWQQRHLAALALGAIGRADSQDRLEPLLRDPELDVRVAAATAILLLR